MCASACNAQSNLKAGACKTTAAPLRDHAASSGGISRSPVPPVPAAALELARVVAGIGEIC